jgi:hypothetical protein
MKNRDKPNRLDVWGDSMMNKLPSVSRKRRKREASKKRRVTEQKRDHVFVAMNAPIIVPPQSVDPAKIRYFAAATERRMYSMLFRATSSGEGSYLNGSTETQPL